MMSDAGIKGGKAGTRMMNMILELADSADELGLDIMDASGNLKSMADVLAEVEKAGYTSQEMIGHLGRRAGPGFAVLMEQGSDALREYTAELEDSGGTAERVAEQQMEGLNGALKEMRSAFQELQIAIADSGLLEFAEKMITRLTAFFRRLSETNPAMLKWATIIAGVAAAMGPLLIILGQVSIGVGAAMKAIAGMRGVMLLATKAQYAMNAAMAANPIGMKIMAVAALTAALIPLIQRSRQVNEVNRDMARIMKDVNGQVADEQAKIKSLTRIIENNNVPLQRRKEAIEELNKIVPEYNGYLTEEGELLDHNTTALYDYIDALRNRYQVEAMQERMVGLEKQLQEEKEKLIDLETDYALALEDGLSRGSTIAQRHVQNIEDQRQAVMGLERRVEALTESYAAHDERVEKSRRAMETWRETLGLVNDEFSLFVDNADASSEATDDNTKAVNENKTAWQELNEEIEKWNKTKAEAKTAEQLVEAEMMLDALKEQRDEHLTLARLQATNPFGMDPTKMKRIETGTEAIVENTRDLSDNIQLVRGGFEEMEGAQAEFAQSMVDMSRIIEGALQGITSAFVDMAFGAKVSIQDVLKEMTKMIAMQLISATISTAFGGGTGGVAGAVMSGGGFTPDPGVMKPLNLNIPGLASGGIAYDDTLVRVGEYAGVKSNPEVIAPLSDLSGLIMNSMQQAASSPDYRVENARVMHSSSLSNDKIEIVGRLEHDHIMLSNERAETRRNLIE